MDELPPHIRLARELRKKMTPEERILWSYLRNRQMKGFKFLRQYPVEYSTENGKTDFYVADFYCSAKKLVLELDGKIHLSQIDYDRGRDSLMEELRLNVVRIKNEQINFELIKTLKFIESLLD